MNRVVFEVDAKYQYDDTQKIFYEICQKCNSRRKAETTGPCDCGHDWKRVENKFFTLKWTPAQLDLKFPDLCPHCLKKPSITWSYSNSQFTRWQAGFTKETSLDLLTPVCKKVLPPLLLSFIFLVAAFFFVVVFLGALFSIMEGIPFGLLAILAVISIILLTVRKAQTWFRFTKFDQRSYQFKIRHEKYAIEFARLNGGRVL